MIVKSIAKNIEYVPLCDRAVPEKDKAVFIMRHPTLAEKISQESLNILEYEGEISRIIKDPTSFEKMVFLVRDCIIDIRNLFIEGNNNPLTWKDPGKDKVLNHIYQTIPELFTVLMQQSELDGGQEKN